MRLKKIRDYRAICPSLDAVAKQSLMFIDEAIGLAVISELLELHGRNIANFFKNIRCNVNDVPHFRLLSNSKYCIY